MLNRKIAIEELKNFILEKIKKNKAILGETDKYGKRYT